MSEPTGYFRIVAEKEGSWGGDGPRRAQKICRVVIFATALSALFQELALLQTTDSRTTG